jgi:prepilin-type N-terminal cleavage/methylation domain-containing protein
METNNHKSKSAFTLPEILVVTTLFVIISTGLATFMVDMTRGTFWVSKKALISNDVRNFTLRVSKETLGANTGYVYPNYQISNRDQRKDRQASGETGDCLVLIHTDPHPDIDDPKHYSKIVIYYRRADEDGRGPVYRVEKEFDPPETIETGNGYDHFETFMKTHFPDHNSLADSEIVLELSQGLADGKLFHNLGNNSFVINGEIIHGNKVQEVTNTYNLTISPRG